MIKKLIKFVFLILFILILAIFYLSVFGIKTDRFNNQITDNILKINKKINLKLSDIHYLLNPYNFSVNVKTKDPQILLEGRSLAIKNIQTNIALKSLINKQFLIDDLQIVTDEIKVIDIIALARIFKNSPQLFVLETFFQDGVITANINLNFDEKGKIKKNYKIKGSLKKAKLNILNQVKLKNLNFNFDIVNNIYLLMGIDTKFDTIRITSPLIEIKKNKDSFFVKGQILNDKKDFNVEEFKQIFTNLFNDVDIQKIEFSSKNDFSFNINKRLKLKNIKVQTVINLNQLIINGKNLKLKSYLPRFKEEIKLEDHKILIDYNKNNINIKGSGNLLIEDKLDSLTYEVKKDDKNILFDTKINFKNNLLLIDFLDYEKKEGSNSLVSISGILKENDQLRFNLINLKEKNNEISIKDLDLSKNSKIINIKNFYVNYRNNKNILNKFNLKKENSKFILEGESFDASSMINDIMDKDNEDSSIFKNLNSKIKIKIKKVYIDDINYMNNLYGNINFDNNKVSDLNLDSTFPNNKKINLSVKAISESETITKLFSSYPKPLIKRYDFIKGFEEGFLDFYSSKKDGVSNSVLIIDNFKVKEVPIFAKLLTLASLQGIADLLTGEGIRFTDFEMSFSNKGSLTTIDELYAIGPAVSLLMDGYIESKKLISLRGTLVPATTINRSIASIPLLGKILIGKKSGEGVFGVSFKIKGPPKNLKTSVNPIKTLTPRFITRTLEKIKTN